MLVVLFEGIIVKKFLLENLDIMPESERRPWESCGQLNYDVSGGKKQQ